MSVTVAGVGHAGQVLQLQKAVAEEGKAPVATLTASVSQVSTNSAQSLTALASFLTQLGGDSGSGSNLQAPADVFGGDGADSLLNQLESDLKSLFSDLQSPGSSNETSASNPASTSADDSLLTNLESSFKTLFPGPAKMGPIGSDPMSTGDSGDSLLATLEHDLKTLFADLQAPGKSASLSNASNDATRLAQVIDAYAAEAGKSEDSLASGGA